MADENILPKGFYKVKNKMAPKVARDQTNRVISTASGSREGEGEDKSLMAQRKHDLMARLTKLNEELTDKQREVKEVEKELDAINNDGPVTNAIIAESTKPKVMMTLSERLSPHNTGDIQSPEALAFDKTFLNSMKGSNFLDEKLSKKLGQAIANMQKMGMIPPPDKYYQIGRYMRSHVDIPNMPSREKIDEIFGSATGLY